MKNRIKAAKKSPPASVKPGLIKFHVEIPLELNEIIVADANRANRSRRRHIAYLLEKLYEDGSPRCCSEQ